METGLTLFQLNSERGQPFDGSTRGISILKTVNANAVAGDNGFQIQNGFLELARHAALDNLQTFTISASITPTTIAGDRRNIAEAQTPGIAFFIDPSGKLTGSVNTASGWQSVDSGSVLLKQGTAVNVSFARDATGVMTLQINGQTVGSKQIAANVENAGPGGFKVGAGADGQQFPFVGTIQNLAIVQGVESAQTVQARAAAALNIANTFKAKTGMSRVSVVLETDPSRARLQHVRDIMNAAGVQRLTDLSTLQIKTRTVMTPGKVLVAPRASGGTKVNWSQLAQEMATANVGTARTRLAQFMTNRNSSGVLTTAAASAAAAGATAATRATTAAAATTTATTTATARPAVMGAMRTPAASVVSSPALSAAAVHLSVAAPLRSVVTATDLSASATQPIAARRVTVMSGQLKTPVLSEQLHVDSNVIKSIDTNLLQNLEHANPLLWPTTGEPEYQFLTLKTIPINTAVIIAHVLDLTNTELVIDASVTKLYILAEQVTCGPGATITWQRPGGSTPGRLDDPDLNGRGWSGVQTKPNSRDGLDGASARGGAAGIDGARGRTAPDLEMWVKSMSAVPNIDLNGEDGIKAGTGQRGGTGGDGGDGHLGERWWFFGWHCSADPGDGGDGGNGGNGGAGGRGGNGGNGGNITMGVLQGTLASTVTNQSFKIKDQGGQKGAGGDGASGGFGGNGGRSGNGETCGGARDGHHGAQGQPGAVGAAGNVAGLDGDISFFEFTQDAWDEMLARPWITQLVPTEAFPGDTLIVRGSAFTVTDRVVLDGVSMVPTLNVDQSLSVAIPLTIAGGEKSVIVRRDDGTESNRLSVWIKPQLDAFTAVLAPNAIIQVTGHAFLNGASVLVNGQATPANVNNNTNLSFTVPGTGGGGSSGGTVTLQVRNPDGRVSNLRTGTKPRILEIPFAWGTNNLPFPNFTDGVPDWGTFEDTFGTAEVWHELLDPIFGHPILTTAFFLFYVYFLKGKGNGGLATGFCTSLASVVADNLWKGDNTTHTQTKAGLQRMLTAVHGKLLSRQSLLHFHDQGRDGLDGVERRAREIEATFLRGTDRQNAPLLFYIPAGDIWDSGYFDKLSDSHCVMPYRFVYPPGHPGPQLSADGTTTISSLDNVSLFVWDCNHPDVPDNGPNCRLEFHVVNGKLTFSYFPGANDAEFTSSQGITLGMMTNGAYMLADHDLPFSGPLGLTAFIIDFLLSPADLQVTDGLGLRTGNFGGQILSEIPDSHPCYLMKGMYLLPNNAALTRTIVGNGNGNYTFNSIMPNTGSLVIENVPTQPGHQDVLSVNADGTQIRFSAAADKTFDLTICRQVDQQARAISVKGLAAKPGADVDLTISPDLSLVRIGNRNVDRTVEVRAFSVDKTTNTPVNKSAPGISLPTQADLVVAVPDWNAVTMSVQTVPFQ